jgi:hypothetical protein
MKLNAQDLIEVFTCILNDPSDPDWQREDYQLTILLALMHCEMTDTLRKLIVLTWATTEHTIAFIGLFAIKLAHEIVPDKAVHIIHSKPMLTYYAKACVATTDVEVHKKTMLTIGALMDICPENVFDLFCDYIHSVFEKHVPDSNHITRKTIAEVIPRPSTIGH